MTVFLHQLVPVEGQRGSCEPLHPFEIGTTHSLQSLESSKLSHTSDSSVDSSLMDILDLDDLAFLQKFAPDAHKELTRTTFNEGLPGVNVQYDHDHCSFPDTCGEFSPIRLPPSSDKSWLRSWQLSGHIPFMTLDTALDFLGEDGTCHTILADCMRRGMDRKDSALMHNSLELFILKPVDGRFIVILRGLGNQSQGKRYLLLHVPGFIT